MLKAKKKLKKCGKVGFRQTMVMITERLKAKMANN